MRKLARQAVVFGLVGMLLAMAGFWIDQYQSRPRSVDYDALAKQAGAISKPIDFSDIGGKRIEGIPDGAEVGCPDGQIKTGTRKVGNHVEDICAEAKDPWTVIGAVPAPDPYVKYGGWSVVSQTPARRLPDLLWTYAVMPLGFGCAFGFPGGLVLWGFYRLIYFAVRG